MEKTPEELAEELDDSFEKSKERAEGRPQNTFAPLPDKPGHGSGSETTDDGTGSRW